jgi:beta-lactamase regulating signal transducer with metallopeptidase domain
MFSLFVVSADDDDDTPQAETGECLETPEMKTVVAVMGVIIALLLLAFLLVLFLYCRRRRGDGGKSSYEEANSTVYLSTTKLDPGYKGKGAK